MDNRVRDKDGLSVGDFLVQNNGQNQKILSTASSRAPDQCHIPDLANFRMASNPQYQQRALSTGVSKAKPKPSFVPML